MSLAELCDASELPTSLAAGLFGRHAAAGTVLREHRKVRFHLLIEVTVDVAGSEVRTNSRNRQSEPRQHGLPPSPEQQQPPDHAGDSLPVFGFGAELLPPGLRNGIKLRPAIVLRRAPLGRNPPFLHQTDQAEIDRALIDLKRLLAKLLNAAGDAISMQTPHRIQRLQHHQIESALQNLRFVVRHVASCGLYRGVSQLSCGMSRGSSELRSQRTNTLDAI